MVQFVTPEHATNRVPIQARLVLLEVARGFELEIENHGGCCRNLGKTVDFTMASREAHAIYDLYQEHLGIKFLFVHQHASTVCGSENYLK